MTTTRPKLLTNRLCLRPIVMSDAKRIQQLAGDPRISATTATVPYPYLDGMAEKWIAEHETDFIDGEALTLGICFKESDELIGCISLSLSQENKRAELGYWVGVDYWNQGVCTEAARSLVAYGFNELNLNKITAAFFAHNIGSGRVMQKIGMTQEGHLKQDFYRGEKFLDKIIFGYLRSEFKNALT